MKNYRPTELLKTMDKEEKYREGTQKYYVVRALVESKDFRTLDDLFDELNGPPYWATVKHKDRSGKPLKDSWFILEAGGVRGSIRYHLNQLEKDRLVEVSLSSK